MPFLNATKVYPAESWHKTALGIFKCPQHMQKDP